MALNKTMTFDLELKPGGIPPIIHASQGDIGRMFKANIYWDGSAATSYVSGATVNLRGKKPDKTVFDYTATLAGSMVTFETTEQMTIVSGPVECELVFSNDGDVIASANFVLIVEESPYNPDALSESDVDTLGELVSDQIPPAVGDWLDDNIGTNAALSQEIADAVNDYVDTEGLNLTRGTNGVVRLGSTAATGTAGTITGFSVYDESESESGVSKVDISAVDGLSETLDEFTEIVTVPNDTEYLDAEIEWTTGVYYSYGQIFTGGSFDNNHYCFFDVEEGDTLTSVKPFRDVCCFANGSYVPGGNDAGNYTFTVPAGVDRVAITRAKTITKSIWVFKKSEERTLKDNIVTPGKTTFFYISGNLADPEMLTNGEFVNQNNGAFDTGDGSKRTSFIEIESGTDYCLMSKDTATPSFRYAFYNDNKSFLTGALLNPIPAEGVIVTAPGTAKYIVVSEPVVSPAIMIKKSTVLVPFESYDNTYILPKYTEGTNATVNFPKKVYAVAGQETFVYFENIVQDWTEYDWNVNGAGGYQMERGFCIAPSSMEVGSHLCSIEATKDGKEVFSFSFTLIVASANAGNGSNASIIILGDSTTNNGITVSKIHENFSNDVMSVSTLGTRGTSPNNHEGRSGWTFDKYFAPPNAGDIADGVENPWYNPTTETFDASYYFSETNIEKPNWFFINLGINDVFSYTADETLNEKIASCVEKCDAMIASIKAASPSTKIGVCLTIPPNHSQDAFGKAYRNGQTRDRYKRNNLLFVHALINEYDARESENIYVVPLYLNLDTVYNMGLETMPVNARNTAVTYQSPIANGGVHPVESGYWQIADVYTAFLKATI